jgi:Fur family transcriptional regulator, ferric uptake regulator
VDHEPVIEEFRSYLREHNLPVTPQRLAVAEVLLLRDRHFTVDEIEQELRARGIPVGTATVYRTLEVLVRSGLVVERDFGEGFKRYESSRGMPEHEHLLCTVCGRVVEFQDERLDRMSTLLAQAHGFATRSHRLVIYGTCAECQQRTP